MKSIYHTEYMNTSFLQCVFFCELLSRFSFYTVFHTLYIHVALACHHENAEWHYYYQLQC